MKVILLILSILAICLQTFAEPLPQRQRRMAIYHLEQSNFGQSQISTIGGRDVLFESIIFGDIERNQGKALFEIVSLEGGEKIKINAKLLASSPAYLSWIVSQSIAYYRLFLMENQRALSLPPLTEISQWAAYKGMNHWQGLSYPNEKDFAKHPDPRFRQVALDLLASTSEHSDAFKNSSDVYFNYIKSRNQKLGLDDISIQEFLNSSASEPAKNLAKDLLQIIKAESPIH